MLLERAHTLAVAISASVVIVHSTVVLPMLVTESGARFGNIVWSTSTDGYSYPRASLYDAGEPDRATRMVSFGLRAGLRVNGLAMVSDRTEGRRDEAELELASDWQRFLLVIATLGVVTGTVPSCTLATTERVGSSVLRDADYGFNAYFFDGETNATCLLELLRILFRVRYDREFFRWSCFDDTPMIPLFLETVTLLDPVTVVEDAHRLRQDLATGAHRELRRKAAAYCDYALASGSATIDYPYANLLFATGTWSLKIPFGLTTAFVWNGSWLPSFCLTEIGESDWKRTPMRLSRGRTED